MNDRGRSRSRLSWAALAALGLLAIAAVGLSGQAGAAPSFPSISISDASVTEGDSGATTMTFTVSLSSPAAPTTRVAYSTADGSATTADGDYVATSGTLFFPVGGPTSQTVNVTVNGDTKVEPDETFTIHLSGAIDGTIARGTGTGTIVNDDVSSISIGDATVTEGNSGTTTASFPVTLSTASFQTVSVGFSTSDGSATAGSDYSASSGTVTFSPGNTSQTVDVTVNGDTTVEPDETFAVTLSGASGATIADGSATGTIVNDDATSLSIGDATVTEGNSGAATASFPVTLTAPSASTITVGFSTSDGTASSGSDYSASSGTVTFSPGNTSQTVDVTVNGDTTFEPDETFTVTLSGASGATIADGSATGTIVNDDTTSLSIGDATLLEGDSGTTTASFPVTLTAPSASTITVGFATSNGTATAGSDYIATSGTLTFNPGDLSKTIAVTVNGDTTLEPDETFTVTLSGASGATIADGSAAGTIVNDDPTVGPDVSIVKSASQKAIIEGGQVTFTLLVTNNGVDPAFGVLVTDSLPSGLELQSIKSSSGSCSETTCNIGTIQGGGGTSVTVVAQATAIGKLVNTASVSTSPRDPLTTNNSAQATVDVSSKSSPPPPPPPAPSAGEVNVVPNGGTGQCVALKGQACAPLEAGKQFDIGDISYINPGTGTVEIRGIEGIGTFFGTSFGVKEILPTSSSSRTTSSARIERPVLVLKLLGGSFKTCSAKKAQLSYDGRTTQAVGKRKAVRRLWGKGKGRFRTQGRYSAGTVRGTYWLTEDDCEGTFTRVVEGVVQVHDLVKGKYVNVHAGHQYLAKAGPIKKPKKKK